MSDDLVITPDEVRAVARVPWRSGSLAGALTALLPAVISFAALWPLPAEPDPTRASMPAACCAAPRPPDCVRWLPMGLRGFPTAAEYVQWRTVDVVRRLDLREEPLPPPPRSPAVADAIAREDHARNVRLAREAPSLVRSALREIDPWYRDPSDPDALLRLGTERDWSADPPRLPLAPMAVDEELDRVLRDVAPDLESAYEMRVEAVFHQKAESDAQRIADEEQAYRDAIDTRRDQAGFAAAFAVVSAALAAIWAALGPREIAVGVHSLSIGRREIPWSEVSGVDWGAERIRIRTRTRSWSLGPRTLGPEARSALAAATDRAIERARSLGPPDPDALRRLDALRRDRDGASG